MLGNPKDFDSKVISAERSNAMCWYLANNIFNNGDSIDRWQQEINDIINDFIDIMSKAVPDTTLNTLCVPGGQTPSAPTYVNHLQTPHRTANNITGNLGRSPF